MTFFLTPPIHLFADVICGRYLLMNFYWYCHPKIIILKQAYLKNTVYLMYSPTINQHFRCLNGRWTFPHQNTFDSSLQSYFDSGVRYSSILFLFRTLCYYCTMASPFLEKAWSAKCAISLCCCRLDMKHLGVEQGVSGVANRRHLAV